MYTRCDFSKKKSRFLQNWVAFCSFWCFLLPVYVRSREDSSVHEVVIVQNEQTDNLKFVKIYLLDCPILCTINVVSVLYLEVPFLSCHVVTCILTHCDEIRLQGLRNLPICAKRDQKYMTFWYLVSMSIWQKRNVYYTNWSILYFLHSILSLVQVWHQSKGLFLKL